MLRLSTLYILFCTFFYLSCTFLIIWWSSWPNYVRRYPNHQVRLFTLAPYMPLTLLLLNFDPKIKQARQFQAFATRVFGQPGFRGLRGVQTNNYFVTSPVLTAIRENWIRNESGYRWSLGANYPVNEHKWSGVIVLTVRFSSNVFIANLPFSLFSHFP